MGRKTPIYLYSAGQLKTILIMATRVIILSGSNFSENFSSSLASYLAGKAYAPGHARGLGQGMGHSFEP